MPWLSLVVVLYPAEKKLSSYFYAVAFLCSCVVSCREDTKVLISMPRLSLVVVLCPTAKTLKFLFLCHGFPLLLCCAVNLHIFIKDNAGLGRLKLRALKSKGHLSKVYNISDTLIDLSYICCHNPL